MARGFRRAGPGLVARLDAIEVRLLHEVFTDLDGLLARDAQTRESVPQWARDLGLDDLGDVDQGGVDVLPAGPTDPAIARLLPSGNSEDPLMAAEFRRLTESGVRARKRAALASTLQALSSWMTDPGLQLLSREVAQEMLVALTDVRLVMGERLGIHTDADADAVHALAEAGPDPHDFLTWLQTDLAENLLAGIPREGIPGRRPPDPV
jgi:hypothetical protein